MSAGPTDALRLSARALGPLFLAFAGVLAWRADLGLAGGAAAGLLAGVVLALHPLTEGWREARRALPVNASTGLLSAGLLGLAISWLAPAFCAAFVGADQRLAAVLAAMAASKLILCVSGAVVAGAALTLALSVFVARAPDLQDEGW